MEVKPSALDIDVLRRVIGKGYWAIVGLGKGGATMAPDGKHYYNFIGYVNGLIVIRNGKPPEDEETNSRYEGIIDRRPERSVFIDMGSMILDASKLRNIAFVSTTEVDPANYNNLSKDVFIVDRRPNLIEEFGSGQELRD